LPGPVVERTRRIQIALGNKRYALNVKALPPPPALPKAIPKVLTRKLPARDPLDAILRLSFYRGVHQSLGSPWN
jgi:hypothetical protein